MLVILMATSGARARPGAVAGVAASDLQNEAEQGAADTHKCGVKVEPTAPDRAGRKQRTRHGVERKTGADSALVQI